MARKGFGKNHMRKEKIAVIAASCFVLAALTMTGFYMRNQNQAESDDGYTIDFEALEESMENKNQEIAKNLVKDDLSGKVINDEKTGTKETVEPDKAVKEETKGKEKKEEAVKPKKDTEIKAPQSENVPQEPEVQPEPPVQQPAPEPAPQAVVPQDQPIETGSEQVLNGPALTFGEAEGLVRPLNGATLMPFSMESSIYFQTLDQYKYNPAMMISAHPGDSVLVGADGRISQIYEDRETGKTIVVDLGDGYQLLYGQLQDISVTEGSYVAAGSLIGRVAEPTIYYALEGANLYLQLLKDGEELNPEPLFIQ